MKPNGQPTYLVKLMRHDTASHGWMLTDLARVAGVSPGTITRFLKGQVQTPKTAVAIAKALDRPLSRYIKEGVA